jgi:hypothetical protein
MLMLDYHSTLVDSVQYHPSYLENVIHCLTDEQLIFTKYGLFFCDWFITAITNASFKALNDTTTSVI